MRKLTLILSVFLVGVSCDVSRAVSTAFVSREQFQIPFGPAREALGASVEDGNFQYPRDFTLDGAGRVYIYDTKKHRIARYSAAGTYEIGFAYPATAQQVFAHTDARENLWLLLSDPTRGIYYGVYDAKGKRLREGVFSQFNRYRIYVDDESVLHVVLSSTKTQLFAQTFIFHEPSLLMKKVMLAPPPETHHKLRKDDRTYFIDTIPGAAAKGSPAVQRITDTTHRSIAQIQGDVIYITAPGEIYTRVGDCRIHVYKPSGSLEGTVTLPGLPSACRSIRFDAEGTIYELDGIPDSSQRYSPEMTGMRLLRWERKGD